ncbi:16S rRNA (guanine(527)-N(7))-methyltransferase RsmG [Hyphococcus flavus]|uniref:Ribosomal RNA small subunit methyltransferase G n=1 Tax=Hyphococcus flavus TaxID=1866326 RepID=A0AAE9ZHA2_9PROT|nr:16S rRNA (guanine(527)-N(7))-methyltransferase RsmG [Hyphococcus flavus]WDI32777.1 16S rRNA (guanine(527)-N(7))-methyltransferase RsmG [Hyphococcus flavus]
MTPEEFAAETNVSRETLDRLLEMDRVLTDWSERHNLIARSTIKDRWHRHFLDSAQVAPLLPEGAKSIADLGSGAGFPGLVLAAMRPKAKVTLIESTGKKAAFLTAAGEAMGLRNLKVIPARIESVVLSAPPDVITARALARLDKLLGYGAGIQGKSTRYFLLKGQDVEVELTEAAKSWTMDVTRHQSQTSPDATILEIGNLARAR